MKCRLLTMSVYMSMLSGTHLDVSSQHKRDFVQKRLDMTVTTLETKKRHHATHATSSLKNEIDTLNNRVIVLQNSVHALG